MRRHYGQHEADREQDARRDQEPEPGRRRDDVLLAGLCVDLQFEFLGVGVMVWCSKHIGVGAP